VEKQDVVDSAQKEHINMTTYGKMYNNNGLP